MSWGITISTAISLIATAVSASVSAYGQQQQAKNASAVAEYNYAMQRRNAEVQARMAQQQALWNQQSAMAQYQAQQNNAAALNDQARAAEAQGREQARRMREGNEQALAKQRALYAKSGVVVEGTPLAVMGGTAALLELNVQDAHYQTDLQARALDRKAADERFQAGFSLMDAQIARYEGAAAEIGRSMQMRQAQIERMSGLSQASGMQTGSYATLISGLGNAAQNGMSMYSMGVETDLAQQQLKMLPKSQ